MNETSESNNFVHVSKCTGCGETHIRSSALTDIILIVLTVVTSEAGFSAQFTAPADATATMANIYPALGPIFGVLVMLVGAYTFHRLNTGVTINETGDQR